MDLALPPRKPRSNPHRQPTSSTTRQNTSRYAIDEINAYIAVRDGLLEEAEKSPSEAGLERLVLANNFIANCLKPTREVYLTQCLPEVDTVRELQRCHLVESHIVKLRTRLCRAA